MTSWWQPGQLLFAGFIGTSLPPDLAELLAQGRVGGVVLFTRNVKSAKQFKRLCQEIYAAAPPDLPPLLSIDQEGGRVQRLRKPWTEWPTFRRLGDRDDVDDSRAVAEAIATELSDLGIYLNFSPVVDVDTNPHNPIIGDRSFGAEPDRVSRHAVAMIEQFQKSGVAACAKHFPGHGDTEHDSHLHLPRVPHDVHRLRDVELPSFKAAIEAGVSSVMTAHVIYEAIDPKRPGTLSPDVVSLLRDELGYGGVVFTDDLEMDAISKHFKPKQVVSGALEAGVDVMLGCKLADLRTELLAELERMPDRLVEKSIERVVALKKRYARAAKTADTAQGSADSSAPRVVSIEEAVAAGSEAPEAGGSSGPPYEAHRELARRIGR